MSWQIFKDNIVRMSDNPDAIADIDTVAKTYAREYDAAIKRGKDTIEGISLQKGNVEIMESLFKAALEKGLTSTGPYDLVGEMGKGVIAYWSGAIMNNFPNPKTPPKGAVSNISVTSNFVIDAGQWTEPKASVGTGRILPDEDMLDPSQKDDDNFGGEVVAMDDAMGPDFKNNDSLLLDLEKRQPKIIVEEEAILTQNPEEVIIDTTSDANLLIQLDSENKRVPNTINTQVGSFNIPDTAEPVRIYKNVGTEGTPCPPGYEKYKKDRSSIKTFDGKPHGPNGGIPQEVCSKVSGGWYAHPEAAKFLNLLAAQAKKEGVDFDVSCAYRTYQRQIELYDESKGSGSAATPGFSAHGWGLAVDFSTLFQIQHVYAKNNGVNSTSDKAANYVRTTHPFYIWLSKNAPKYGWYNPARLGSGHGVQEAWHWEYWGFYTLSKSEREGNGAGSVPQQSTSSPTKNTNTNNTSQSNSNYNAILVAGLNNRPGDKSTAEQVSLLQSGLGPKNIKGFDWNTETATILSFLKSNPGLPVFLFSAGCKQAGYISDSPYVNKNKLYVIEPYHSGGETSKSVQKAVKDGVPANHIFVGPNSSRGLGVVDGASDSNSDSHWNALVSVSSKVKQLI